MLGEVKGLMFLLPCVVLSVVLLPAIVLSVVSLVNSSGSRTIVKQHWLNVVVSLSITSVPRMEAHEGAAAAGEVEAILPDLLLTS